MKLFDPKNWYWYVGGDETKAYSSAAGNYVVATDPGLQTWVSDGSQPTRIDTEANLGDVLAPYFPNVQRPVPVAILDGYQQSQSDDIASHKLFKILFNMFNRLQVLEGKQPLTVAQARAAVKGLM